MCNFENTRIQQNTRKNRKNNISLRPKTCEKSIEHI